MVVIMLDSSLVGVYYFIVSFLGSLLGFSFSTAISMELSGPFIIFNEVFYYINVTSHGLVMVFFFLTLVASGFSNYFLPHTCFQEDMILKSLNVLSLWLMYFSFMFVVFSLLVGEGVGVGWTLYVPLSLKPFSDSVSLDLLIMGIHLFSLSSVLGGVNIMTTSFCSLGSFNSIFSWSPFVWGFLVTSLLVLLSVPALSCVVTMLLCDSVLSTYFFVYEFGGDSLLYQVMFWVWGHPEVYILMLPVFSVVSQVIQGCCGKIYNSVGVVISMLSLFVLSFLVWGHHMVTVGWSVDLKGYFMTVTAIMSFPTSVKIFSWLWSVFMGGVVFSLPICCFSLFLFFFSFGGVSGLFLSNSSLDLLFHDGYFVVGHFHFVLANASIFGFLSGLFFFFYSVFNQSINMVGMLWSCTSFSYFLIVLFTPFHCLGLIGLPSSVCTYSLEDFYYMHMSNVGFVGVWVSYLCFMIFLLEEESSEKLKGSSKEMVNGEGVLKIYGNYCCLFVSLNKKTDHKKSSSSW